MPKEQVDELVEAMRAAAGTCRLERVDTRLFRTIVEWDTGARRHEVLIGPRGCVVEPSSVGASLAMAAPAELASECPDAFAALREFVGESREVAPIPPESTPAWTGEPEQAGFAAPRRVATLVAIAALLTGLWLLVQAWRSRADARAPERRAGSRGWWALALAGFALGLLARFAVAPSLGNWYGGFLPVEGWGEQRFGPGAELVQAGVRAILPWTPEVAFGLARVIGALCVPLGILLVRRLGGSLAAAAIAGLVLALEPIPVRLSASSSEHVIAGCLALGAWLAWQTSASDGRAAPRVLALLLAWLAVLTRADCLPQLALLPLVTLLGQPLRERAGAAWLPVERRLVDALWFVLGLVAIGVHAWIRVVVPSNHPGPSREALATTTDLLFEQFWVIAREPPHWLTPTCLALALLGTLALVGLSRARLLACVGLGLALIFVPLGRNLAHDGLTGARYFVLLMPLLALLGAALVELLTHWIAPARRRAAALVGVLGFAALEAWAAQPGWRHEYTFQAEYRFLARALGERAGELEGCTLWFVRPRQTTGEPDLDCCLWPANSPLTLVAPELRFRPMPVEREPADGEGCHLYYEGSVCDLDPARIDFAPRAVAQILDQCERMRARPGDELAGEGLTDQALDPRFHGRPWVRLRKR